MKDHPKGLAYFILVNALFMFGLVDINALLALYVTKGFHFTDSAAYSLIAAFNALLFSASILGGWLGGRYSHRNVLVIGLISAFLGLALIAFGQLFSVYAGLSFFIFGSGCFVPNVLCAVGQLYQAGSFKRQSGYTLVYVGLNGGAFFAALSAGYLVRALSFQYTYCIAACAFVIAAVVLMVGFAKSRFQPTSHIYAQNLRVNQYWQGILPTVIVGMVAVPLVIWLLQHSQLSNQILMCSSILGAAVVMWVAFRQPVVQRDRLLGFLFLVVVAVCFWSLYMLAPSVLTLFIERNVYRHFASIIVPTSSFYALNPFFIMLIGSLLSRYWVKQRFTNGGFNFARCFSIGIFLMGAGYLLLSFAISHTANQLGYISMIWVVLSYLLQSSGELFIGPIGNAMVGSLVPPHLEGVMMGFFQLFMGVAGAVSSIMAQSAQTVEYIAPLKTNPVFIHSFTLFGGTAVGVAAFVMLLSVWFSKLVHSQDG